MGSRIEPELIARLGGTPALAAVVAVVAVAASILSDRWPEVAAALGISEAPSDGQ